MVILYATEQYHPLQTGTATADYGLSKALAQDGHKVYVLTSDVFNHAGIAMGIQREGKLCEVQGRRALEIAPNLWVLEFHIFHDGNEWQGEIEAYIDFTKDFACDMLINSSIYTWNCDVLLPHLATCKAKKKFLRNHTEMPNIAKKPAKKPPQFKLTQLLKTIYHKSRGIKHPLDPLETLKMQLRQYDKILFLHKNSSFYQYLSQEVDLNLDILPNGVFAKDICPPKFLPPPPPPTESRLDPHQLSPHALLEQLCQNPFILNVSNYYAEKGQEMVLKAYYASHAQMPLVFVGSLNSGHTLDRLKALKTHEDGVHGFKEVFFFYGIGRDEVLKLAKHATLFLHASTASYESFPMVLLESMQFATPFICTPVGNALELAPALVAQDASQMAVKINALLGDPKHYHHISTTLHQQIQNLTYEEIVKKLLEF